ncbi:MAG: hypothetical protein A2521_17000 [Deltaproteobacteria bacterium RIFOXYD12_FULL_57_12]|nr:MAG: hypothetical protein A2521_17000 [Deltaproteobacteria bacterium RIFOXYD12_FULL_57_12]
MPSTHLLSTLIVLPGIIFMLASLVISMRMHKKVPSALRRKWLVMTCLIAFFLAGYVAYLFVHAQDIAFPLELLTSTVFLGGALFVFLVMRLTGTTMRNVWESEEKVYEANVTLVAKNVELEEEIAGRRQAEQQAQNRLQHLSILHTIDLMITSTLDLKVTMTVFLEQIMPQLQIDAAAVLLLNPATLTLEYGAGKGFQTTTIQQSKVRLGEGCAGTAALERRRVLIDDILHPEINFIRQELVTDENFTSYCALPLIAKGQVKGVLEIFRRGKPIEGGEWLEFLEALSVQAAIAIDNATLFNELQSSNTELILAYDSTIEGWGHALELRDKETEGHTQRVTEMTLRVARVYGMSEKELVQVRRGGLLHDIGKMGIPDSILMKEGQLTAEETAIMHRHPEYAFRVLSPIAYLQPALDIPYCHHEKWDGSGYPRGLKGEQIPLAARIFALADIWDALIHERRYHAAWPREKVAAHIRSLASTHFDPDLVDVFLANA